MARPDGTHPVGTLKTEGGAIVMACRICEWASVHAPGSDDQAMLAGGRHRFGPQWGWTQITESGAGPMEAGRPDVVVSPGLLEDAAYWMDGWESRTEGSDQREVKAIAASLRAGAAQSPLTYPDEAAHA